MDRLFAQLVKSNTPEMNKDIVNGLAVKMIPYGEQYIDEVIRTVSKSFPPGLTYLRCERCTPLEEFRNATRGNQNKRRTIDTARSDVYSMKYFFNYEYVEVVNGVSEIKNDEIIRYLYLPFVGEAGSMNISNNKIFIHPVLTDKVISPSNETIFVRFMRDKVIFKRLFHSVFINNMKTSTNVVWSSIYRNASNGKVSDKVTKAHSTAIHYLLGKYGFNAFFMKYFGFIPEVGNVRRNPKLDMENNIIFMSTGLKPKTNMDKDYVPTNIYISIPNEKDGIFIRDVIVGIFYILDHFPLQITLDYIHDPRAWIPSLGAIIFSDAYSAGKILEKMDEHYSSLDQYVDTIVAKKLKESGYECADFYDLLALTIHEFSAWLIDNNSNVNTMYDKELSILYPVFYSITTKLFLTAFKLNKAALKKTLATREIIKLMNENLKPGLIFGLNKSNTPKSNVNYSGDNKFFRITNVIIPQANNVSSSEGQKKSRVAEDDPINKLHASIPEVGGYLNIVKPNAVGTGRINPYVTLDENNTIIPNPETREFFEEIQRKLYNQNT
jgi:hypothetical protein